MTGTVEEGQAAVRQTWARLTTVAAKLSSQSRDQRYHVFDIFDWPDELPADQFWMSPELTTCYGTPVWDRLSEADRLRLTQAEAVNFFSLNVHLIRDLIGEVAGRIYDTRYPGLSEFFHDFIHEENEHMWFFAQFCNRYGGKVYRTKRVIGHAAEGNDAVRDVMIFGRILIAEELCDYYNAKMATDDRLPAIAQRINAVHHQDESRHIAFGRQMMRALYEEATHRATPEEVAGAAAYLSRYVSSCLRAFYNPAVYADAALTGARQIRSEVVNDPYRQEFHRTVMRKTTRFFSRMGLFTESMVAW
ncbi:diiron oxygenase [Plantactinospora sp. CA-294935]|uniref:diiron oxygenase n=1 Tax=Plantactinospora sp. CA-294935 TaxID=3240012 RepID=UPI003D8C5B35